MILILTALVVMPPFRAAASYMQLDKVFSAEQAGRRWQERCRRQSVPTCSATTEPDREAELAKVRQDGLKLYHAPKELRADREVVLAAVRQDGLALCYASAELRADREIVFAAVVRNGLALMYIPVELRADRDIVLAAVQQNGRALRYASAELQVDREVGQLLATQSRRFDVAAGALEKKGGVNGVKKFIRRSPSEVLVSLMATLLIGLMEKLGLWPPSMENYGLFVLAFWAALAFWVAAETAD